MILKSSTEAGLKDYSFFFPFLQVTYFKVPEMG